MVSAHLKTVTQWHNVVDDHWLATTYIFAILFCIYAFFLSLTSLLSECPRYEWFRRFGHYDGSSSNYSLTLINIIGFTDEMVLEWCSSEQSVLLQPSVDKCSGPGRPIQRLSHRVWCSSGFDAQCKSYKRTLVVTRAAANTRLLEYYSSSKVKYSSIFTTRVLITFYFRLQISISGCNFCCQLVNCWNL